MHAATARRGRRASESFSFSSSSHRITPAQLQSFVLLAISSSQPPSGPLHRSTKPSTAAAPFRPTRSHHRPRSKMSSSDLTNGSEVNGTNGDFPSLSGSTAAPQAKRDTSAGASSGLSAAQRLQQAHEAQEAPAVITEDPFPPFKLTEDPFPVAQVNESTPAAPARKAKPVDISDESAFPSLGGGNAGKKAATWGSGGGAAAQRIKQQDSLSASTPSSRPATPSSLGGDEGYTTAARSNIVSATVQLASSEIHIQAPSANSGFAIGRGRGTFSNERQAEPTTLGEVMKLLMKRHPTVTVEASTSRQTTTFIIKGKGDNAEEKVAQVKRELLARLAKKVSVEVEVPASLRGFIVGAKG